MSVSLINRPGFFAQKQKKEAKKAPARQPKLKPNNTSTINLFPSLNAELERTLQLIKQYEIAEQQQNAHKLKLGLASSKRTARFHKPQKQSVLTAGFFPAPKPPAPKGNVVELNFIPNSK